VKNRLIKVDNIFYFCNLNILSIFQSQVSWLLYVFVNNYTAIYDTLKSFTNLDEFFLKGYVLLFIIMCVNLYIYKVNVDYSMLSCIWTNAIYNICLLVSPFSSFV